MILGCCVFFCLAGLIFVPLIGIQHDEALFSEGLYEPLGGIAYTRWVFGHKVPVMLMSYVGALKSWLYAPLFGIWTPGSVSVRAPVLLAGAVTLWLFFLAFRKLVGFSAVAFAVLILATDASYLFTTCFDWGPVALQHLLMIGGIALILRFHRLGGLGALAGGFFLFGLALWDKALFSWSLAALAVAVAAVYPRQLWRAIGWRSAVVAPVAFALGALPLILYNGSQPLATFRGNAAWSADDLPGKARLVRYALEGRAMFGYMVEENASGAQPVEPTDTLGRLSEWLSRATGRPHSSLGWWGFAAGLGLYPILLWRYGWKGPGRVLTFLLIFLVTAWLLMACNRGTGGGLHHTVLLWPMPQLFIGVAFATVFRRWWSAPAAVLVLSNLLLLNNYYAQLWRFGAAPSWTEAIYPLSAFMRQVPARTVFTLDWGILNGLRLLNRGNLPLAVGSDPVSTEHPSDEEIGWVHQWTSAPDNVFVSHSVGSEIQYPGVNQRIDALAARFGLRRETLATIPDRNGRPRFEVFRYVR